MSSASSFLSSAARFARRNSGKIALVAVATGTAVAAVTYLRPAFTAAAFLRRQVGSGDELYEEERKRGARRLRQDFLANCHSTRICFRGLLKKLHALISQSDLLDMSRTFASLRERPSDMVVKKALWKQIMVASYTSLITSIYTTALLYAFVCLIMTVLARYNNRCDALDMPSTSEHLPSGSLSPQTSKRLLDLVWRFLLNEDRIDAIIARVHSAARVQTGQLDLAHSPTIEELAETMQAILDHAWEDLDDFQQHPLANDNSHNLDSPVPPEVKPCLRDALHDWVFVELAHVQQQTDPSRASSDDGDSDATYSWLVSECLDICDVLDFKKVVRNNVNVALAYSVEGLRHNIDPLEGGRLPSYAILLSRLRSMATTLVVRREGSNNDSGGWKEDLDEWFCNDDAMKQFAASVFVSGERLPPTDGTEPESSSSFPSFSLAPFSMLS